jgi:acyl-homoserine-lactone acylase
VHGGNRREGVANLQVSGNPGHPLATMDSTPVGGSRLMTASGYPVMHGSSFILTLRFDDEGPVAQALLSYSQSGDAGSPWFSDQTELYRAKQWRDIAFEADAIRDSTVSRVELTGPR